jgi:hypothetical protein
MICRGLHLGRLWMRCLICKGGTVSGTEGRGRVSLIEWALWAFR